MRELGGWWKVIVILTGGPIFIIELNNGILHVNHVPFAVIAVILNFTDGLSTWYYLRRFGVEYENNLVARWMIMKSPVGAYFFKFVIISAYLVFFALKLSIGMTIGFSAALLFATMNNLHAISKGKTRIPLHNYEKRP